MKCAITCSAIVAVASQLVSVAAVTKPNLLIFTKTAGYRHDSISHGIELITSVATEKKWKVTASEDSTLFTTKSLKKYITMVFIHTTGDFLSASEAEALRLFLSNGGTWLGIHAAGDYGDGMPSWYGDLVGGQFRCHPCSPAELCSPQQEARYPPYGNVRPDRINITDAHHPSTRNLPLVIQRTDEYYSYKTNPSKESNYTVLAVLNEDYVDEITPAVVRMTPDHPISWYSVFNGTSRAFYTGLGHTNESYSEPYFIKHVTGGLEWVTGSD